MIDIHTHILPGVDDGAKTIEDSLQMIQQAIDVGIEVICATPHILDGVTPPFQEKVNRTFQLLHSQVKERELKIKLVLGSEIYIRHDIKSLKEFNFFSLNQTGKYILMELPLGQFPLGVKELIHDLRLEGITPIIAHPERSIIQKDQRKEIENWIRQGALMQINAGSVLGHFGKSARKTAEWLLEKNLAHIMASDAHSPSSASVEVLACAFKKVCQRVGEIKAEELVLHNPSKVLQGERLLRDEKNVIEDSTVLLEVGSA
jgi:protein-tyrosine phosphatase